MKATVIPEEKMKVYLKWCKEQKSSSETFCDCGKIVKIELTPYFYDEENNDVYFASICPNCGELIIIEE
jgi:hypothetical protein